LGTVKAVNLFASDQSMTVAAPDTTQHGQSIMLVQRGGMRIIDTEPVVLQNRAIFTHATVISCVPALSYEKRRYPVVGLLVWAAVDNQPAGLGHILKVWVVV
jgi:hypothetical protein